MGEFAPDLVSPPGDTIFDMLTERNMNLAEFQAQTGFDFPYLHDLLTGEASISPEAAWRLSVVLGSTAEFWLASPSVHVVYLVDMLCLRQPLPAQSVS